MVCTSRHAQQPTFPALTAEPQNRINCRMKVQGHHRQERPIGKYRMKLFFGAVSTISWRAIFPHLRHSIGRRQHTSPPQDTAALSHSFPSPGHHFTHFSFRPSIQPPHWSPLGGRFTTNEVVRSARNAGAFRGFKLLFNFRAREAAGTQMPRFARGRDYL